MSADETTQADPINQMPESLDPFGDSATFEVTSEVDTAQLEAEISKRVGKKVKVALAIPLGQIASKDHPGTLFVSPGNIDGRTVRGAIASHDPATPDVSEREALAKKLADGQTLTQDDIAAALKLLLGSPSTV